jgi:transcriptional regulator with XRE-family HTH domain
MSIPTRAQVAESVKAARKAKGLTQAQVEHRLGALLPNVPTNIVGNIEGAGRPTDIPELAALCAVLGVELDLTPLLDYRRLSAQQKRDELAAELARVEAELAELGGDRG